MRVALVFCTVLALSIASPAHAELDATCTVAALNRSARVPTDGAWVLPNVPSNLGSVRIRATCVENGISHSGQSDFLPIPSDDVLRVPEIRFENPQPIPTRLTLSASGTVLTSIGQTLQLIATGMLPDSANVDLTTSATGTTYTTSNPRTATISADGLVDAHASGTVLLSATNEGALGLLQLIVTTSGDADADGLPDDFELAHGLDPNDALDALDDLDHDILTNLAEFQLGTNPRNPDTDADTLLDGEEGTYGTHPLLFDTDGDGLSDGLEIRTGSDPLDPASYNLAAALAGFTVTPASFDLVYNTLLGEASVQLTVTGELIDGNSLDLTATARGTGYSSSDLTVCNFGVEPGRVFAGSDGACTITVSNSGFSAEVAGNVRVFSPRPLGFVSLPGFAHDVEVIGDLAYVAAGTAGIVIADVSDRSAPFVVATFDTPGNCQAVRIEGSTAYVADGTSLRILDLTNPLAPSLLGTLALTGDVQALALRAGTAYVAAGAAGFHVVDVRVPSAPLRLATVDTPGTARGVDVANEVEILLIADGTGGLRLYDLSVPSPTLLSTVVTGDAWGVAARGSAAFVADRVSSLVAVDFSNPAAPARGAAVPRETGGLLEDVALSGPFALGADVFFVNGVPILDVSSPRQPIPRAIVDFSGFRDDAGTGITADNRYLYLTAQQTGFSRLYVGQYLLERDLAGVPPTVAITAPVEGEQIGARTSVVVSAEAGDDVAVAVVRFLLDGVEVATDTVAPYGFELRVPGTASTLELRAIAEDFGGNVTSTEPLALEVVPFEDVIPPSLAITSPGHGSPVLPGTTVVLRYETRDEHALEGYGLSVAGQEVDGASLLDALAITREVSYTVPPGTAPGTVLEVLAEARDYGGNVTTAAIDLVVPVGTTLSGNQVLDSRYTGQSLILAAGTFTAVEPLVLQNLTVLAGARVTAPLDTPLSLTVADALRVQSGGSLDVSGLGWRGGHAGHPEGYAPAGVRPSSPDAGGSHGGVGTTWDGPGLAGEPFGDVYLPGAAGGGGAQDEDGVGDGTRGGGVLVIEASVVVVDGELRARGETSDPNSSRAAGAGGSIRVHAGSLRGTGLVDASGSGTSTVFTSGRFVGPGAGGRVALHADRLEGFDPATQTRVWGGRQGTRAVWAGSGTVLVKTAEDLYGGLIVDNGEEGGVDRIGPVGLLPALGNGGGYRFDRLELRNGARLDAVDPVWAATIVVSGDARLPVDLAGVDMLVRSGAVARPARAAPWIVSLSGTLTVEPGAVLDVSGQGYLGGRAGHPEGEAPPGVRPSSPDAGGSHGGVGATWDGPGPVGEVFGSVYLPSQAGGGGSQDEDGTGDGTRGGGVLILEVETLELAGEIRARGETGDANSSRPAGAGGSVQIHAGTLRGAGLVDVSGSSTSTVFNFERFPGPGGGGRVALWVDDFDGFDPAAQVRAWGGARQRNSTVQGWAGPGTVYVREAGGRDGRLIVDNGAGRGAGTTPLPALGTWPATETEIDGEDLWVSAPAPFLPRWLGAWAVLRDGAGGTLGSYRVGEIDALGRVRLLGAGGVVGAVEIAGAYRFEAILTPNGTVVTASDPVVVGN